MLKSEQWCWCSCTFQLWGFLDCSRTSWHISSHLRVTLSDVFQTFAKWWHVRITCVYVQLFELMIWESAAILKSLKKDILHITNAHETLHDIIINLYTKGCTIQLLQLLKMKSQEMSGHTLTILWITDYLTERLGYVRFDSALSDLVM